MKRFFVCMAFLLPALAFGQTQDSYTYSKEFIWGIGKNNYGGLIGHVFLRSSKAINEKSYRVLGLELTNVKHPTETKYVSNIGNVFIYGKTNYLYAIRGQYGRDIVLFKKAPQQGVQISFTGTIGPSIGLIAPYYVEIGDGNNSFNSIREPYDPKKHPFEKIAGTGYLFQGLFESDVALGVNLKAGLKFEYGAFKNNVTGFEIGVLADYYTKPIPLMASSTEYSLYPTLYISVFWGVRK